MTHHPNPTRAPDQEVLPRVPTLAPVAPPPAVHSRWDILEAWVRSVCWRRVPLLGAALLLAFPITARSIASPMLRNMFEIGWAGMALVAPMAVLSAWLCGLCARLAQAYLPERSFETDEPAISPTPNSWIWTLVRWSPLALPVIIVAILESRAGAGPTIAAVGLGAWLAMTCLPLLALGRLDDFLDFMRRWPFSKWVAELAYSQPPALRDGYVGVENGVPFLYPGHVVLTTLMVILLAVYTAGVFLFRPGSAVLPPPTAIAYLILLHMLITALLSGMAFFLDRFRVPLLVILAAFSLIAMSTRNPYFFEMHPVPKADAAPLPAAGTPFAAYKPPAGHPWDNTAVVVCASGGGIQSAAWTASVLTWLQEDPRLGPQFTRATRFYSGVSGGSVGIMYFLAAFDSSGAPPDSRLAAIRDVAARSSVSEVAWGIVYPDLGRNVVPGSWSANINRAWALEQAWRRLPQTPDGGYGRAFLDDRWSAWVRAVRDGQLPGVAFNAFDIVSGNRIILSNVSIPEASDSAIDMAALAGDTRLLDVDMDVVTAARLSATFPYVTPISRPKVVGDREGEGEGEGAGKKGFALPEVAVADGGYFDNAGFMTASEWIRSLAAANALPDAIKRIIVIEIRAFEREGKGRARQNPMAQQQQAAVEQRRDDAPPPSGERSSILPRSWTDAVIGPLEGLLKTRTSSQIARNDLDLKMLTEVCACREGLTLERVVFEPQGENWPLSWHLSTRDLEKLEEQKHAAFDPRKDELVEILFPRGFPPTGAPATDARTGLRGRAAPRRRPHLRLPVRRAPFCSRRPARRP